MKPASASLPEPVHQLAVGYGTARMGVPAARSFRRWVEAALRASDVRESLALAIQLVDAEAGRALNLQYRQRDYATNVLSFPACLPPGVPALPTPRQLGDLVICAPVVAREASEQGKSLNAHYALMTVHGVLHLLGHDHEEDAQAAQMEALEVQILAALGWPDPYAA
jgi:probable rRNA maturation factor